MRLFSEIFLHDRFFSSSNSVEFRISKGGRNWVESCLFGGMTRGARRDVIFSDLFDRHDSREFLKVTRAIDAYTFLNSSSTRETNVFVSLSLSLFLSLSRATSSRNFSVPDFTTRTNRDTRNELAN